MTIKISEANIDTATLSAIAAPKVANIQYAGEDDTAASTAGGELITINGSGFAAGASILIGGTVVGVVTFMSSNQLTFISPANTAGSYVIYVINTDGGTAISIPGIQYSGTPAWTTGAGSLGSAVTNSAISITLAATGDAPVTYSVFSGTLPPGVTLNSATGFLSGTTPTVAGTTTYSFVIRATDLQNQDTNRSFSFTVTVYVGKLYSWGYNPYGELGQGNTTTRNSPVQVGSLINWSSAAGKYLHALVAKTDGTLWGWGRNSYGRLGLGDTISRSSPVQVGALTNWAKISTTNVGGAAIKTDGTLWTWGANYYGVLGLNDAISRSSPVQVGALTTWLNIASGTYYTIAIKTDYTLWAWGRNYNGALGDGTTNNKSNPVQIGALTTWLKIASGFVHVLAIKTDGTLWAWGGYGTNSGVLGDGTTINRSSPVQIGSLTTWSNIAGGNTNSAAIKTDGTLWTWGQNNQGELGHGNTIWRSSPVQVGALTTWNSISAGGNDFYVIKTDGALWSWGNNGNGALGHGDNISRSSPTQVGSLTTWINVTGAEWYTMAISS